MELASGLGERGALVCNGVLDGTSDVVLEGALDELDDDDDDMTMMRTEEENKSLGGFERGH